MPVKAELHIPDLWFDFYARFLPGAGFVAAIRILVVGNLKIANAAELFVLAFAGYLFALISQPISSRLARFVENWAAKALKRRCNYVAVVQKTLGRSSREAMILSKMHGEVTFFAQLSVLSITFQVIQGVYADTKYPWTPWLVITTFVFLIFAFEVATRRVTKAMKYDSQNRNTS